MKSPKVYSEKLAYLYGTKLDEPFSVRVSVKSLLYWLSKLVTPRGLFPIEVDYPSTAQVITVDFNIRAVELPTTAVYTLEEDALQLLISTHMRPAEHAVFKSDTYYRISFEEAQELLAELVKTYKDKSETVEGSGDTNLLKVVTVTWSK